MSKKILITILSVVLLIGGATIALAATTDQASTNPNLSEIKGLYDQIFSIQSQIIDKEVEAGVITQTQADIAKKNLQYSQQYQDQAIDNGGNYGYGGYGGYGMMGGYGGYGMMGGYYGPNSGQAAPGNPTAPSPSAFRF